MEKLSTMKIGGKTYPVKIDLNVLQMIQEEFETINNFERDILGLKFKRDEEGKIIYKEDGEPDFYVVEPSVKAIMFVLPLMVNEGLEIDALQRGVEFEPVNEKLLIASCDIAFEALARKIHAEYRKCFVTKK